MLVGFAPPVPQDSIYRYDEAGRLSRVTDPSATVSYGYDAAGNRKLVSSRIPNLQKTNPIEHRYRYDYDGANRVQTVIEADLIVDASGTATGLKNATGQTFQFDANGNRVFQQDYSQGSSTQSITAGSGEAGIYDALTAFATPARASQGLSNSFDARNRLTEVRTGGSITSRRVYDNSNALDCGGIRFAGRADPTTLCPHGGGSRRRLPGADGKLCSQSRTDTQTT